MRIHTVAALYVFAFSFFFHLSRTEYAVLFLTFAAVIMGELLQHVGGRNCRPNGRAASTRPCAI